MLPPALVDYTLSRLASPYNLPFPACFCPGRFRHLQHAALALKSPEPLDFPQPASRNERNRCELFFHMNHLPFTQSDPFSRRRQPGGGALKVRSKELAPPTSLSAVLAQKVAQLEKVASEQVRQLLLLV